MLQIQYKLSSMTAYVEIKKKISLGIINIMRLCWFNNCLTCAVTHSHSKVCGQ